MHHKYILPIPGQAELLFGKGPDTGIIIKKTGKPNMSAIF
jgi:hypothetical protein